MSAKAVELMIQYEPGKKLLGERIEQKKIQLCADSNLFHSDLYPDPNQISHAWRKIFYSL